jgi:uncharacterized protein DUF2586
MTQPAVNITELDGQLGVLPASSGRLMTFLGPSSIGPINTPATFARVKDIVANFGQGPMVEAAARSIDTIGRPVVIVRTAAATIAALVDAVVSTATGSAAVTMDSGALPNDDYEIVLKIVHGGTKGAAGITYQYSLDGGRTYSPVYALGTAAIINIAEAGATVTFDIATGTLVAGDMFAARAHAAQWNTTELGAALDSLVASAINWEQVHVVGPIDANAFDSLESKFAGLVTSGKYRSWIGNARIPNAGESEATYLAALNAIFSGKSSTHGALAFGAAKTPSGVNGRIYRRPFAFAFAAAQGGVDEQVDVAAPILGALPGIAIRDANGNVDEHDESINPGADDARFVTARTIDGYEGVFVNIPRLFSPAGSDFQIVPHRRVLNLAHAALRQYFIRRLNSPVLVNASTGFILEHEALEIEAGAKEAMRSQLLAAPKASAVNFVLSRTDNLLSTKTLTGSATVTPLAYPQTINLDVGFLNPALQVQTA